MDRLIIDLGRDGRVRLSTWVEGEFPDSVEGEPPALDWPLGAEALEDLRWYLEDYLGAPFGVYGDRGPVVAEQLGAWGAQVFSALFGGVSALRDAYVRLRARGRPLVASHPRRRAPRVGDLAFVRAGRRLVRPRRGRKRRRAAGPGPGVREA